MKKFNFIAISTIVVCAAAVAGYTIYDNSTMTPQELLMKKNIEALAQLETWKDCGAVNYSPNAEIHADSHSTTVTSDSNGNIEVDGVVKGGYKRNRSYYVTYEIKNCETREGACCDQKEVGISIVTVSNG